MRDEACSLLLDHNGGFVMNSPPPWGRFIEFISCGGRVDLTKGGAFGVMSYQRTRLARAGCHLWCWRTESVEDISQEMYEARLRLLSYALSGKEV